MDQSSRPLSDTLTLLRDAAAGLQSEDLQGVDAGSLLTDVADLRRLVDQVEGEWSPPTVHAPQTHSDTTTLKNFEQRSATVSDTGQGPPVSLRPLASTGARAQSRKRAVTA